MPRESVSGHLFVAWPVLLYHCPKLSPAGTDEMKDSLSHFLYKKGLENAVESKPVSSQWPRENGADVSGRMGMRESGWRYHQQTDCERGAGRPERRLPCGAWLCWFMCASCGSLLLQITYTHWRCDLTLRFLCCLSLSLFLSLPFLPPLSPSLLSPFSLHLSSPPPLSHHFSLSSHLSLSSLSLSPHFLSTPPPRPIFLFIVL